MNSDFRVSVDFFVHHKTRRVQRQAGDAGVIGLLLLWAYAAKHRSDGMLAGMDQTDIEAVAGWTGETGLLFQTLLDIGFLDQSEDGLRLHDWQENNPWVAGAMERSQKAKNAADIRWGRSGDDKAAVLAQTAKMAKPKNPKAGKGGVQIMPDPSASDAKSAPVSDADAAQIMPDPSASDAKSTPVSDAGNAQSMPDQPKGDARSAPVSDAGNAQSMPDAPAGNAPSPSPSPSPSPIESEIVALRDAIWRLRKIEESRIKARSAKGSREGIFEIKSWVGLGLGLDAIRNRARQIFDQAEERGEIIRSPWKYLSVAMESWAEEIRAADQPDRLMGDDLWRFRLGLLRSGGAWSSMWGPPPMAEFSTCLAPDHVLAEFGYDKKDKK